jgi:bifunctional pyridoxal-dependent enzyme with beta-cystathionase and maltose regulon repressor activities
VNFDKIIDRNEYPTLKWNKALLTEHFGNDRALPFWVVDGKYQLDFDDLEEKTVNPQTKIMIICKPHQYTPFASISDELAQNSVTCLSPAKTFN